MVESKGVSLTEKRLMAKILQELRLRGTEPKDIASITVRTRNFGPVITITPAGNEFVEDYCKTECEACDEVKADELAKLDAWLTGEPEEPELDGTMSALSPEWAADRVAEFSAQLKKRGIYSENLHDILTLEFLQAVLDPDSAIWPD